MRIGFDAKRAYNNFRGLGNYSRDTIRILSSEFPENQYFLFTPKINPAIDFSIGENCNLLLPSRPLTKRLPSLWRTFSITKEAQEQQLEVYHGLSHELPYGIERTGIRTVVTIHDLIFLKFPKLYPFIDRILYKKKYLHSCRIADKVVAVSEQTRRDLMELAGVAEQKITVIHQGCSPVFKESVSKEKKEEIRQRYQLPQQFVLNVGAMEERKNQILILEAMRSCHTDFHLVIAGRETEYARQLKAYIQQYHLEKRVTLLPDVPVSDLPALYQTASLFIYPSLFEGFGIPIIEAMQSGLPIIATTGSCLEESGGEGSLYVSPYNAEELAHQISYVLEDESQRERMLEKNKSHLELFSDGTIAQKLKGIYSASI